MAGRICCICKGEKANSDFRCNCSGETTQQFLTVDHVYGGGNRHCKEIKSNIYTWLVCNNFPEGFQLLCYNCNCAKGHYGSCPHTQVGGL